MMEISSELLLLQAWGGRVATNAKKHLGEGMPEWVRFCCPADLWDV